MPTFEGDQPSPRSSGWTDHGESTVEEWFLGKVLIQSLPYMPTPKGASLYTAEGHHQKPFAKNPFVCNGNLIVLILVS